MQFRSRIYHLDYDLSLHQIFSFVVPYTSILKGKNVPWYQLNVNWKV